MTQAFFVIIATVTKANASVSSISFYFKNATLRFGITILCFLFGGFTKLWSTDIFYHSNLTNWAICARIYGPPSENSLLRQQTPGKKYIVCSSNRLLVKSTLFTPLPMDLKLLIVLLTFLFMLFVASCTHMDI